MEAGLRQANLRQALPWLRVPVLALAYFGAAWVGLRFALSDSVASPVWPPAGLAVAFAVLWGWRSLPAVAIGAFLVEWSAGVPAQWSLLMAAGSTAEAGVTAWLVVQAGGAAAWQRPTGVLQAAMAAAAGPLLSSTAGVAALLGSGAIPLAAAAQVWSTWYLGDMAGIIILAPPVILAAQAWKARAWQRPARAVWLAEAAAAFALLAICSYVVFVVVDSPVTTFVIAPLVWIAIRLGPGPTSLAVLLLDAAAVVATSAGRGPYADSAASMAFLLLQAFMLTVSLLAQAVAAVAADRRRAANDLEDRIRDRTRALELEVDERRRAQDAVDEAQKVAHLGTWRWDITKPNAEWSPELFRIYGLDAAKHTPTYEDYLTRVHPDDVERVKAATESVFKDHKSYSHDERVRRPDGSWRHLHTWASAVLDKKGKLVALVGTCQDITEQVKQEAARKQAERALAESLERFRALADASPIGIAHTTAQGAVDYANHAWLAITGLADYRDTDAVRKAVHPEDQPQASVQWLRCVKDGLEFDGEIRFVRPDGEVRLTRSRSVPVRDEHGVITGFVSAVQDITEMRKAEQAALQERESRAELRRLREQAEFKTNFLRTAAHELGTPLTPIKIQLRVLRDLVHRRQDTEEGKAVGILERNVDRLLLLVRDLLESARLQSGRLRLNPRSMDLAHLVHDVVETFQEPAIQSGISLDAQMPRDMAMVGDPDRITQVLYNLISNAMKFTPPGGRVHVQADDLGDTVQFLVQDTGMGFKAEQARNLFQPFSQVHDLMQSSKPGSGLGLYICKGIVEQHGGAILAYSEGPGRGARFVVNLPRVARPPGAAPAAEAQVETAPKTS